MRPRAAFEDVAFGGAKTQAMVRYDGRTTHEVEVAGVRRILPVVAASDGAWIAAFVLFGDVELTNACAHELASRLRHFDFDALVSTEAKAVGLVHMIATYLSDPRSGRYFPYVVCRKSVKGYMKDPLAVEVRSITTQGEQQLVLDGADVPRLRGKRVAVVDDVVSTGGTMAGVEQLLARVDATVAARAAVLLEGDLYRPADLITLGRLPVWTRE